ncbi:hypothetical protein RB531_1030, partial [Salmonella enterica subsp. enterica serovar Typhimurium]
AAHGVVVMDYGDFSVTLLTFQKSATGTGQ